MRRPQHIDDLGGAPLHVAPGRTIALSDPGRAWVVRAGAGEVRCRRMSGDGPAAAHRFLGWVTPGDVLLVPSSGGQDARRDLSLHAIEELVVSVLPLGAMRNRPAGAGMTQVELIEKWLTKLAGFIAPTEPALAGEKLPRKGATHADCGQVLIPFGAGVVWIRIDSGSACLMGISDLRIRESPLWIPICRALRLEACEGMTLHIAEGSELDKDVSPCDGLREIHRLCDKYLDLLDLEAYRGEIDRLQRRRALHERDSRAAMSALQSVLDPAAGVTERESPLLTAMNLVGEAIGVEIRPPPKWEERDRLTDPVEAVARASGLRHRRVLLRGRWWTSDAGPLLAFRTDGHQPVALHPRGGGYDMVDPAACCRTRVNAGSAASLEPEAVMFYRPYPGDIVRPRHLIPFLLRGQGRGLLLVLSLAVLAALAGMLTPVATALLMDEAIPAANTRLATELGLALLAAAVGILIFGFAQGIVSTGMSVAVESAGLSGLWDRLLKVRVPFFSRFASGDLLARASALSEASRELNGATVQSILAALTALLYLGLLALLNLRLAMMAAGLAGVAGVVTAIGAAFLRRHLERMLELEGAVFGSAVQMINAVSKVRVAGAQRRAFSRWANRYAQQLRHLDRVQHTEDLVAVFTQAIPVVGIVMLFWMGAELLLHRQGQPGERGMSVGTFLAFQTAMTVFFLGVHALCLRSMAILRTGAKVKRTSPVLAAPTEAEESRVAPGRLSGSFSLSHVVFRYRAQGRKILDDVSIRVDPGEFVSLVGPSGSGKSTMFRLILGFETPESGTVAFDGKDLRTLDVVGVRRQLGVVLQAGQVTAGSLLQNICPGGRITLDDAWEAAEDAGLAEDIRAMPMGLHTIVSEGGRNLSGGQRQRLLIARALVTRPRVLLMDEATSALDNATQAIVAASLDRRKVSRLVIAHRLSTVRQASRVYVLDQGRVVEEGNFEELLREQGLFASMMERHVA